MILHSRSSPETRQQAWKQVDLGREPLPPAPGVRVLFVWAPKEPGRAGQVVEVPPQLVERDDIKVDRMAGALLVTVAVRARIDDDEREVSLRRCESVGVPIDKH